jgi:hypothetical protein
MDKELEQVKRGLESDILKKVKDIETNILTGKGPDGYSKIEMLAMINDELSDVLLNWDDRLFDTNLGDELM